METFLFIVIIVIMIIILTPDDLREIKQPPALVDGVHIFIIRDDSPLALIRSVRAAPRFRHVAGGGRGHTLQHRRGLNSAL